jgi:hypothetical protein
MPSLLLLLLCKHFNIKSSYNKKKYEIRRFVRISWQSERIYMLSLIASIQAQNSSAMQNTMYMPPTSFGH